MITLPNVKLNLGLNVLRRRSDGYHDLETLFVPYFDVHDTLEIVKADDYSRTSAALFAAYKGRQIAQGVSPDGKLMITVAREEGVDWNPLDDLCAKAYALLDADFHLPSVKIFLKKESPVGAGLGGGSSDAAFTLKMLDEIFDLDLSKKQLAAYASRLGSDCAFFIYNHPMLGSGRGDILEDFPMPVLEGYSIKLYVPRGIGVSTAEAYKGIEPAVPSLRLADALRQDITTWKDTVKNDFEKAVFRKYPQLAMIKMSLYGSGAVYASMSGSGSALYGIFEEE